MNRGLEEQVWWRANSRCEYCHFPAEFAELHFQIEHIIAKKHGGTTDMENLALACYYCNSYKGPNLSGVDPLTNTVETLFHPRKDTWAKHFKWSGAELVGLTRRGRATINVLKLNEPEAVNLRRILMEAEEYPT